MTIADYLMIGATVVAVAIIVVVAVMSRGPGGSMPFRASRYRPSDDPMPPIPPEAWIEAEKEAEGISAWMSTGGTPTKTEQMLVAAVRWARYQRALRTCGL